MLRCDSVELFLSSSVVEQSAVNRLVVGSSPTWGDSSWSIYSSKLWKMTIN